MFFQPEHEIHFFIYFFFLHPEPPFSIHYPFPIWNDQDYIDLQRGIGAKPFSTKLKPILTINNDFKSTEDKEIRSRTGDASSLSQRSSLV